MRKDIHSIDNHLIRAGWIVFAVSLLGAGCASMAGGNPLDGGAATFFNLVVLGALAMLAVGYFLRSREKRVIALWNLLEQAPRTRAAVAEGSLGMTRKEVREALILINAQPGARFVWDEEGESIIQGDLFERVVRVDRCTSCGANLGLEIRLDSGRVPACAYCGSSLAETIERAQSSAPARPAQAGPAPRSPRSPFSWVIFIVLLIVFWPAAVVYALWKSGFFELWSWRWRFRSL